MLLVVAVSSCSTGQARQNLKRTPEVQSISKTRPSHCVILSASEGSLAAERSFARAQDDTGEAAWFDWQHVFFELDWPRGPGCLHTSHIFDIFRSRTIRGGILASRRLFSRAWRKTRAYGEVFSKYQFGIR